MEQVHPVLPPMKHRCLNTPSTALGTATFYYRCVSPGFGLFHIYPPLLALVAEEEPYFTLLYQFQDTTMKHGMHLPQQGWKF